MAGLRLPHVYILQGVSIANCDTWGGEGQEERVFIILGANSLSVDVSAPLN